MRYTRPGRRWRPRLSETSDGLNQMPHSMTGFASADVVAAPFRLTWELRSVNHRYLELAFRFPEDLRGLETECRDAVAAVVKRGKLDCTLRVAAAAGGSDNAVVVDAALGELKLLEDRVRAVDRKSVV